MTTASDTPSLKQAALGDLDHEIATTRRVLERVPDEHLSWKPHEKSMSLGGLASHIANLMYWQTASLQHDEFDLASAPPPSARAASRDELLRSFDANASALRDALAGTDDAALARPWTLRHGDRVILQQPKLAVLRGMGISHIVHHRGHLRVYLRLLDIPVPAIYGPSADEGRL